MLFLLTACGSANDVAENAAPAGTDQVMLGVLTTLTGPNAGSGTYIENTVRMAVNEINAAGGVNGKQLVPVFRDVHQGWPDSAAVIAAATDELQALGAVGIIGPNQSAFVLQVAPRLQTGLTPLISPAATSPSLTTLDDHGLVWRSVASDAFQGRILAQQILQSGISSLSIIQRDDAYGNGLSAVLAARFVELGGSIRAHIVYPATTSQFSPYIEQMLSAGQPEGLALVGFGFEGSAITVELAAYHLSPSPTLFGADSMRSRGFLDNASPLALGMYGTSPTPALSSPDYQHYYNGYVAEVGQPPGVYGSNAYDAVYLYALALHKAGTNTRAAILSHLQEISRPDSASPYVIHPGEWARALSADTATVDFDYQGASGAIDFDDAGDVTSATYAWWQVVQTETGYDFVDLDIIAVP